MSKKSKNSHKKFVATTISTAVVASAASAVAVPAIDAASNFSDVSKGAFYEEAVNALAQKGVLGGYEDGTFKPAKHVTRAEAAKILAYDLGLSSQSATSTFSDVKTGDWFYQPVSALSQAGGIGGYEDGTFQPNKTITRAEMASMLVKAYGLKVEEEVSLPFTDVSSTSWYVSAVEALYANNITSGKSATSFAPNDVVTRGEIAAFVYRASKLTETPVIKGSTIENITDTDITISGVTYTVTDSVKNILGSHNAAVLAGASVQFEETNGVISKVTGLQLNASGKSATTEFASNVVLDGKGSTISGNVVINGDYISLKNVTVDGDLTISEKLANDFYSEKLTVKGDTVVNGGDDNTVVFKDSKLENVKVNKADVRVEAKGSTTVKEITISKDATIVSDITITKIKVEKDVKLSLGNDTKVDNIELPEGVELKDVVTSSSARKNIKEVNDSRNSEYSSGSGGGGGGGSSSSPSTPTPGNTHPPVAKPSLDREVAEGAANLVFNASDLATDADGSALSFTGAPISSNGTAATVSLVNGQLVVNVADDILSDDVTTITVDVTDGKATTTISFDITVTNEFMNITGNYDGNNETITVPVNVLATAVVSNMEVLGDLIIDPGDDGEVTLDNVTAQNIIVRSGSMSSVILNNTSVSGNLKVENDDDVRIEFGAGTVVNKTTVNTTANLEVNPAAVGANAPIISEIEIAPSNVSTTNDSVTLAGDFGNSKVKVTKAAKVTAATEDAQGNPVTSKINSLEVNIPEGGDNTVELTGEKFAETKVNISSGAKLTGTKVDKVTVSADSGAVEVDVPSNEVEAAGNAVVAIQQATTTITQIKAQIKILEDLLAQITKLVGTDLSKIVASDETGSETQTNVSDTVRENPGAQVTEVPLSDLLAISNMQVSNGEIKLMFNIAREELEDDFALTDVTFEGLAGTPVLQDYTGKTATYTFDRIERGTTQQTVIISASYKDSTNTGVLYVPKNNKPVIDKPIADVELLVGGEKRIDLSKVFKDPDNDPVTYAITAGTNATIVGNELVINATTAGTINITVTATDSLGATNSASFKVKVNHKPVGQTITLLPLNEGHVPLEYTANQLATDADINDTLTLVAGSATSTNPNVAKAEIKDGKLVVTPAQSVSADGTTTIKVKVTDGKEQVEVSFNVEVKDVNHAPVAKTITVDPVNEGSAAKEFTISDLATDEDGDTLTLVADSAHTSDPTVATAAIVGNKLVVTPAADLTTDSTATIRVSVTDGKEVTEVSFNIVVKHVNRKPVSQTITVSPVNEGSAALEYTVAQLATDPDGDTVTLVADSAQSSNTAVATAAIVGDKLVVTPAADLNADGTATITVRVSDGKEETAVTFNVVVKHVNRSPVGQTITLDPVDEGSAAKEFTAAQLAIDPDGDTLTLVAGSAQSSDTAVATAAIVGDKLVVTPVADLTTSGTATITVRVSDGTEEIEVSFNVVVNHVNRKPVSQTITLDPVNEGSAALEYTAAQLATDPDGDTLTLVADSAQSSNTAVATAAIISDKLVVTPAADLNADGTATITVRVSDGKEETTVTFNVVVKHVNRSPVGQTITLNPVDEGSAAKEFTAAQLATDEDGDTLTLVAGSAQSSNTTVATAAIVGDKLVVTPVADLTTSGTATITVRVSDGTEEIEVSFNIAVNDVPPVTQKPTVTSPIDNQSVTVGGTLASIDLNTVFADSDTPNLIFTASSSAESVASATVTGSTLVITVGEAGEATITVTANDGTNTVSEDFVVTVTEAVTVKTVEDLGGLVNDPANTGVYTVLLKLADLTAQLGVTSGSTVKIQVGEDTPITLAYNASYQAFVNTQIQNYSAAQLKGAKVIVESAPPVTQKPTVTSPIDNQSVTVGGTLASIDLNTVFADSDTPNLTFTASSSAESVASATVTGSTLVITVGEAGEATITVTANDGTNTVSEDFVVTVTEAVTVKTVEDLGGLVNDPANTGVYTVLLKLADLTAQLDVTSGSTVKIQVGEDTPITLAYNASYQAFVNTQIQNYSAAQLKGAKVIVESAPPVTQKPTVTSPIDNQSVTVGGTLASIDLNTVFADSDTPNLTFTASSSAESVASATVTGSTLVIAVGEAGEATITVTANDGTNTVSEDFVVTVTEAVTVKTVEDLGGLVNDPANTGVYTVLLKLADLTAQLGVTSSSIVKIQVGEDTPITLTYNASYQAFVNTQIQNYSSTQLKAAKVIVESAPPVNQKPIVVSAIENQEATVGGTIENIDLLVVFEDSDTPNLTFTAISSAEAVASAVVTGSTLSISIGDAGTATITVTANDGTSTVTDDFIITVSEAVTVKTVEELGGLVNDPANTGVYTVLLKLADLTAQLGVTSSSAVKIQVGEDTPITLTYNASYQAFVNTQIQGYSAAQLKGAKVIVQ
ncbi:S-layer homology domain-containing protein [Bacillus sp. Marseille-P3661]|uniref:S-layer homology domain-containing protein n=1 Tax=Bacillus sp. Marseille-P3661 TaxID=1936234 RepID=UPI000C856E44|nr:S-layer homology domain-containing protein [Bacillus sp. Marseille-P3661]